MSTHRENKTYKGYAGSVWQPETWGVLRVLSAIQSLALLERASRENTIAIRRLPDDDTRRHFRTQHVVFDKAKRLPF